MSVGFESLSFNVKDGFLGEIVPRREAKFLCLATTALAEKHTCSCAIGVTSTSFSGTSFLLTMSCHGFTLCLLCHSLQSLNAFTSLSYRRRGPRPPFRAADVSGLQQPRAV